MERRRFSIIVGMLLIMAVPALGNQPGLRQCRASRPNLLRQ